MWIIKRVTTTVCAGLMLALLAGCSQEQDGVTGQSPVPITSSDTCHLCGMIIKKHPGPKGELYVKGQPSVKRFCSTMDLFSWLLQPENQPNVQTVYVHDMSKSPWQTPDDNVFINARDAWYVVNSRKQGAMGATLASFATEVTATEFARDSGGEVIRFNDIDLSLLSSVAQSGGMHDMAKMAGMSVH